LGDDEEATILNRIVRWGTDNEVSFEADPNHVEKMIEDLSLKDCKPNIVPGSREERKEDRKALEGERVRTCRSVVARANYLSQDRPDIRYSIKELCRKMSAPTMLDWQNLKQLCRYLKGRPRMVQQRKMEKHEQDMIEVYVDSDWAGCPETRRSTTGGAIVVRGMCLKTWSVTQKVVARSSGEAELYAAVRGAAEGLGLRSMAKDLGWCWKVRVWTDSSACKGTCGRQGLGRVKHLEVEDLWIQEAVKNKKIFLCKVAGQCNPADLMTKFLTRAIIDKHAASLGLSDV
jgi:hypothetical protein